MGGFFSPSSLIWKKKTKRWVAANHFHTLITNWGCQSSWSNIQQHTNKIICAKVKMKPGACDLCLYFDVLRFFHLKIIAANDFSSLIGWGLSIKLIATNIIASDENGMELILLSVETIMNCYMENVPCFMWAWIAQNWFAP